MPPPSNFRLEKHFRKRMGQFHISLWGLWWCFFSCGCRYQSPSLEDKMCWGTGRKAAVREEECSDLQYKFTVRDKWREERCGLSMYRIFFRNKNNQYFRGDALTNNSTNRQKSARPRSASPKSEDEVKGQRSRYSPVSWGRRRTGLRSEACPPAAAPSPLSSLHEAGHRKKTWWNQPYSLSVILRGLMIPRETQKHVFPQNPSPTSSKEADLEEISQNKRVLD